MSAINKLKDHFGTNNEQNFYNFLSEQLHHRSTTELAKTLTKAQTCFWSGSLKGRNKISLKAFSLENNGIVMLNLRRFAGNFLLNIT